MLNIRVIFSTTSDTNPSASWTAARGSSTNLPWISFQRVRKCSDSSRLSRDADAAIFVSTGASWAVVSLSRSRGQSSHPSASRGHSSRPSAFHGLSSRPSASPGQPSLPSAFRGYLSRPMTPRAQETHPPEHYQ